MIKYKITSVESIQYKAAVSITGAIRRTSKEKLLEKLDLESVVTVTVTVVTS